MKLHIKFAILGLMISYNSVSQKSKDEDNGKQEASNHFLGIENRALSEKFRGVEVSDGKVDGLFPIKSTGVSTLPIKKAADQFLGSLALAQQSQIKFDINDIEWRRWINVDNGIYARRGISLTALQHEQKHLAFNLMQVSLSAKGLKLTKDIMKTDQTLKELNDGSLDFDEELYFFTFMGTPSITEPWGWQLEGHHLVINYFILGDQVVMSPVFMGAEPVLTTTGKYKGNVLFQDEQNLGLSFMQSLSDEHQEVATISTTKRNNDIEAEAYKDNVTLDYEGISTKDLSESQQKQLLYLISQYVNNMKENHGKVKMEDVKAHFGETWFAWKGDTTDDAVFYYRIHSPVILIEFDHQGVVGIPDVKSRAPTRNHIHTIVRTPNGNDYGKDLLRQHLDKHHH